MFQPKIIPVILSGGVGSRLWPLSRDRQPKQFLPLLDGESMFHRTLERVVNFDIFLPPMVVTGQVFQHLVEKELARLGCGGHIILEPQRRGSAAAIAAASALALEQDPHALLYVMAADHLVSDIEAFVATVRESMAAALEGWIVTFGITPDRPTTGLGYIEPGETIVGSVNQVAQFIEKPTESHAAELISTGCLWNSGNFLFRADVMIEELQRFAPKIAAQSQLAVTKRETVQTQSDKVDLLEAMAFAECPAISIDFAVMEHSRRIAVIPASYGWSDIGSWDALWAVMPRDAEGNALSGATTVMGTHNSLVSSTGPHVVVLDLANVAVIATPDAVLVAPRQVANALKPLVAHLQRSPATNLLTVQHQSTSFVWGQEEMLISTKNHILRRVQVKVGFEYEAKVPEGMLCHVLVVSGEADTGSTTDDAILLAGRHLTWTGPFHGKIRNSRTQVLILMETLLNLQSV